MCVYLYIYVALVDCTPNLDRYRYVCIYVYTYQYICKYVYIYKYIYIFIYSASWL